MKLLSIRLGLIVAGVLAIVLSWIFHHEILFRIERLPILKRFFHTSADDQIAKYGAGARARIVPKIEKSGLHYPPANVAFVAVKSTNELLVYAAADQINPDWKYVCTYPILGASGHLGPKLRSGDCQVPEGIYELSLEPNTPYHLALRLNYPNPDDLVRARADGRDNPGSDILIHGNTGSIGCLAMGDEVSEDLFVLVYDSAIEHVSLIIEPVDFRHAKRPDKQPDDPVWLPGLYDQIEKAAAKLPGSK